MAIQTRTRLLATTLFAGVAAFTPAAMAQTTSQAGATQETTNDGTPLTNDNSQGDIIVTGTLIRNPNIVASSPVAVVTESELQLRNIVNAEQAIRDVPGAVAGTGSQVNNGNGGFATANLRGLGSQRNLILLDGDRMVTANQQGTVDLNNIPLALVQRTDVLTGGASTTYGADAVSGVINFITRSDFAGVDASASQRITERGDANLFRADVSIGANFDDGRGNAVFSVGYQEADALYQGSRDVSVFTIGGNNGVAAGASPTSVPTRLTFSDGSDRQINPNGTALQNFYSGFNFAPYNIFVTPFKRYNMYGAAKYDVSDTVEVYTRGIFSKNVVSTIIAPSGIFGEALTVPGNNPYLPAAVRDEICTKAGIALGATCNNNAALPITVFRRTVEIGPRISEYTTQFFDYKAGLRLNISGSTKLDVSGAYGESTLDQVQSGYVLRSRVQQALNANNTTTCQVTTNNCVPLNLFGPAGSITADQAAFLNGSSTIAIKNALSQAKAVLTGNFDSFSPVSTNPVGYAIGAEYRKYTYVRRPDSLAISPGELGGAGGAILPFAGGYEVKEAYGEIIAPLIADAPFFHSLTIEGGVRYSDYKVDAATSPSFNATTWKAGGSWEPIQAIKFRGNYQRAVRAPNIAELFAPSVTGLANQATDPCGGAAPLSSANLRQACLNQGAPVGTIGVIGAPAAGQVNVTGGGNINIRPEIADTFTAGVVIQPKGVVPGLTITADYYNIIINNAITLATPGDILANCFGTNPAAITAAQAASTACTSIRRNPTDGRLSGSPANTAGLPQPLTNEGRLATDGVDVNLNYQRDMGLFGLTLNFAGNWTHKNTFRASPTAYNRDCAGYYSVNCLSIQPEFSWNQRTTFSFDKIDLSVLWRYLAPSRYEGIAPDAAQRGVVPAFQGVLTGPTPLAGQSVNFNRIGAYHYFDLSARFQASENFDFTFSVANLFDRKPPVIGNGLADTSFGSGNTYPSTYDVLGRTFNVGARLHF